MVGGVKVVVVEVDVDELVVEVDVDGLVVVDEALVVVVVLLVVVVVVDSSTGSRPPFRSPRGSLAPEAGLPARVDGMQVGNSTRFCFVLST